MTVLDFTESEPTINSRGAAKLDVLSDNAAFYERLQGTRKTAIERYSWIALPIAAVAVLGIVAATSTPNRSADNIAAGPVDAKPALAVATPAPVAAPAEQASAPVSTPQSAPAPVHVARRAAPPAPREPMARAASATQPRIVPSPAAPDAVSPPVASAPAEVQAPVVTTSTPVEPAPAEAPAQ
jgi:hypothetical protein